VMSNDDLWRGKCTMSMLSCPDFFAPLASSFLHGVSLESLVCESTMSTVILRFPYHQPILSLSFTPDKYINSANSAPFRCRGFSRQCRAIGLKRTLLDTRGQYRNAGATADVSIGYAVGGEVLQNCIMRCYTFPPQLKGS